MIRLDRPTLTVAAVRLLARRTPYLEREMLGLPDIVGPGSVCVDIGAAAGLYTVALSQLAGPTGQVHSIEPLPFVHPLWTRVLRAGTGRNVRRHTLALGAEPGEGLMSVPLGKYGGPVTGRSFLQWRTDGLGSNSEFKGQMEVKVEVETLDGLCDRLELTRLDFLKIDVEGAELHVLEGGHKAIDRFRPAILVEIEDRHIARYQHSAQTIVDWFAERGYTMHTWQHGWQRADSVSEQTRNYLFRPPAETA
ncbi:MAG TPA: FkbM family methyltransferase [Pseudonocardiaceae bacterium]|nr:FkbM family methyltransferase [Pseudonocardiaceae bacterium]